MNPPTVIQPGTADRTRHHIGVGAVLVVVGLLVAVVLTFLVGLSSGPGTVSRITFQNPTVYALDIEVSPGTSTGWTSAGSVRQNATADVHEVIDQGATWVFRFDSQGASGGELHLTRTELEAAGWRVDIPPEVGVRLAEAGAPPTP